MTSGETNLEGPLTQRMLEQQLDRARRRTLGLVDPLSIEDQMAQHSRLMSPLVWDLAHVGNYEDQWLNRALGGAPPEHPEYDDLYDAFKHARADRPDLPLLDPAGARRYLSRVRHGVLERLRGLDAAWFETEQGFGEGELRAALLRRGFVYGMVIQHEHQHDETMLATIQLMAERAEAPLGTTAAPSAPPVVPPGQRRAKLPDEVVLAGGQFLLGTDDEAWAYDNERPQVVVDVDAFRIDRAPVTNERYLVFMDDGGYERPELWSPEGWAWRNQAGLVSPEFWSRTDRGWEILRFGEVLPLPLQEPVQHVCWYEADAFARWAGRRLPTEVEWEYAASWDPASAVKRRYPWGDESPTERHANLGQRHRGPSAVDSYPDGMSTSGCVQLMGDVWEWTSSDFLAYPASSWFPYPEYSDVFYGHEYKVLRGGSWATDPCVARATFRNWDYPIRRQIFAGFRSAADC